MHDRGHLLFCYMNHSITRSRFSCELIELLLALSGVCNVWRMAF